MSEYPGDGYPSYGYQGRRLSSPQQAGQLDGGIPNGAGSNASYQPGSAYGQGPGFGGPSGVSGDGGATLLRLLRRGETLGQEDAATTAAAQQGSERRYSDLEYLTSSEQRKSPGPWFGQPDPAVAAIGPSRPSYQPLMGGAYRPSETPNGTQQTWHGPPDARRQSFEAGGPWSAGMHPLRGDHWSGGEGLVASGRPQAVLQRLDTLQRLPSDIFEDGSGDLLRMLQGNQDAATAASAPPRSAPKSSGPSSDDAVYQPGGLPRGQFHHPAPEPIGPRSNPPAEVLGDIWAATEKESKEWAKGGGVIIPSAQPEKNTPLFQQSLSFGRWQSVAASVLDDDPLPGERMPSPRGTARGVPSQRTSFEEDLVRRGGLGPGAPLGTVEERPMGAHRSVFDEQYARYAEQVAMQAQSEYFYAQQRRLAQAQMELFYQQQAGAQNRSAPGSGRSSRSSSKSPLRQPHGKGPRWPEYDAPPGAFSQYDLPLKPGQGLGYDDPLYWQSQQGPRGPFKGMHGKGAHGHFHEKPGVGPMQQWVKVGDQGVNPGLGLGQHLAKANYGGARTEGPDGFGSFSFPVTGDLNGGQRLQHSDNSGGSGEGGHHPKGGRKTPKNRTPKGTPKGTPTGSPLRSRRGDSKSPLKGRDGKEEGKEGGRGRRGEREPQKPKSHMEWRQKSPTPPKGDGPTPPEGVTPQGPTPRAQSPERAVPDNDVSKGEPEEGKADTEFLHALVRQLSLAELQQDMRERPPHPEGSEVFEQHQDMPSGEERAGTPTAIPLHSPIAMAGEQARAQARANAEARAQAKESQARSLVSPPGFGGLQRGFGSQQQIGEGGEEKRVPQRLEPQLSFKQLVEGSLEGLEGEEREAGEEKREEVVWKEDSGQGLRSVRDARYRPDMPKIDEELLGLVAGLIPTEEEDNQKLAFVGRLKSLFEKEWPGTQLYLFGSCANSFGVRNSDVDMCLGVGMPDGTTKADVVERMAGILNKNGMLEVQALTHARVPIVKFRDHASGIACDICVNNMLAVANTSLLFTYAQIDGRLRQLAFAVKHWAKRRQVNETYRGTLSSYAYVLMCIHYMQGRAPPILPVLQEARPITYRYEFGGVECAYNDQVENFRGFGAANEETLGELLAGFFEYWAYTHNYNHDVICVRLGRTVSKEEKDWTRRIGSERHLICIEDPFETRHDLGRVVDRHSIRVLRDEFHRAVKILRNDPDPVKTLFEPYVRADNEY